MAHDMKSFVTVHELCTIMAGAGAAYALAGRDTELMKNWANCMEGLAKLCDEPVVADAMTCMAGLVRVIDGKTTKAAL
jgi:hypothetical protein